MLCVVLVGSEISIEVSTGSSVCGGMSYEVISRCPESKECTSACSRFHTDVLGSSRRPSVRLFVAPIGTAGTAAGTVDVGLGGS